MCLVQRGGRNGTFFLLPSPAFLFHLDPQLVGWKHGFSPLLLNHMPDWCLYKLQQKSTQKHPVFQPVSSQLHTDSKMQVIDGWHLPNIEDRGGWLPHSWSAGDSSHLACSMCLFYSGLLNSYMASVSFVTVFNLPFHQMQDLHRVTTSSRSTSSWRILVMWKLHFSHKMARVEAYAVLVSDSFHLLPSPQLYSFSTLLLTLKKKASWLLKRNKLSLLYDIHIQQIS